MTYYGQNEIDKTIHEKYFLDKRKGFFIECGAADGITDSTCLFFEKELEWTGINIEPMTKFYNILIENRKDSRNINVALSNFDGHTKFTEVNFKNNNSTILGWSSINNWNDLEKRDNTLYTYDTYDVNCVKFSSIFTEKNP